MYGEATTGNINKFFKAMEQRQVNAAEFLPKFWKEYNKMTVEGLKEAEKSYRFQQNRMLNSFTKFKDALFKNVLEPVLTPLVRMLNDVLKGLTLVVQSPFGKVLGEFLKGLMIPLDYIIASFKSMYLLIVVLEHEFRSFTGLVKDGTDRATSSIWKMLGALAGMLMLLKAIKLLGLAKMAKDIGSIGGMGKAGSSTTGGTPAGGKNGGFLRNIGKRFALPFAAFYGAEQGLQAVTTGESDISRMLYNSDMGANFMDRLGAGMHNTEDLAKAIASYIRVSVIPDGTKFSEGVDARIEVDKERQIESFSQGELTP